MSEHDEMQLELSHDDIGDLLGAYALDAVEPDEAAVVAEHLAACPRCAAEVAEHREVAALLANTGAPAPEGVWGRILDSLEEPPPDLVLPSGEHAGPERPPEESAETTVVAPSVLEERRSRRRAPSWLPISAAAAAVMLVVGLFAGAALDDEPSDAVDLASVTIEDVARRALADSDARQVTLTSSDGRLSVPVAIDPDGTGYLLGSTLPPLSRAETYQLWAIEGANVISAGVLGSDPDVVAFHLDGSTTGLAITREVAGGVASSENPVLLVAELS